MGSTGGKHCESLQRNVWRGVLSPLKRSVCGHRMPYFAVCVEISSFCIINAINSIDKHSLREVECEIYCYWIYTVIYMTKRSRIYSANLGINVGAHLSFLVVITWCVTTLGHDQRCACGLWQDNNTHKIQYIPSIVVTNRHSVVIAAEPSVTKSPPLQIKSRQNAAFCVQRHCFFNGETTPRHTLLCSDLQYLPPGDAIILCACITKSLITGKSFFFGYEYPLLTAAIACWHWLCGKHYLNMDQNSQLQYSSIV